MLYLNISLYYDVLIRDKFAQELLNDVTSKVTVREFKKIVEEYAVADWFNKKSKIAKMRTTIK